MMFSMKLFARSSLLALALLWAAGRPGFAEDLGRESPKGLRFSVQADGKATISWEPVASTVVKGYNLYRVVTEDPNIFVKMNAQPLTLTSQAIKKYDPDQYNKVVVAAVYEEGLSDYSPILDMGRGKPLQAVYFEDTLTHPIPSGLKFDASDPDKGGLSWEPPDCTDIQGYNLYKIFIGPKPTRMKMNQEPISEPRQILKNYRNIHNYGICVTALYPDGESGYSEMLPMRWRP